MKGISTLSGDHGAEHPVPGSPGLADDKGPSLPGSSNGGGEVAAEATISIDSVKTKAPTKQVLNSYSQAGLIQLRGNIEDEIRAQNLAVEPFVNALADHGLVLKLLQQLDKALFDEKVEKAQGKDTVKEKLKVDIATLQSTIPEELAPYSTLKKVFEGIVKAFYSPDSPYALVGQLADSKNEIADAEAKEKKAIVITKAAKSTSEQKSTAEEQREQAVSEGKAAREKFEALKNVYDAQTDDDRAAPAVVRALRANLREGSSPRTFLDTLPAKSGMAYKTKMSWGQLLSGKWKDEDDASPDTFGDRKSSITGVIAALEAWYAEKFKSSFTAYKSALEQHKAAQARITNLQTTSGAIEKIIDARAAAQKRKFQQQDDKSKADAAKARKGEERQKLEAEASDANMTLKDYKRKQRKDAEDAAYLKQAKENLTDADADALQKEVKRLRKEKRDAADQATADKHHITLEELRADRSQKRKDERDKKAAKKLGMELKDYRDQKPKRKRGRGSGGPKETSAGSRGRMGKKSANKKCTVQLLEDALFDNMLPKPNDSQDGDTKQVAMWLKNNLLCAATKSLGGYLIKEDETLVTETTRVLVEARHANPTGSVADWVMGDFTAEGASNAPKVATSISEYDSRLWECRLKAESVREQYANAENFAIGTAETSGGSNGEAVPMDAEGGLGPTPPAPPATPPDQSVVPMDEEEATPATAAARQGAAKRLAEDTGDGTAPKRMAGMSPGFEGVEMKDVDSHPHLTGQAGAEVWRTEASGLTHKGSALTRGLANVGMPAPGDEDVEYEDSDEDEDEEEGEDEDEGEDEEEDEDEDEGEEDGEDAQGDEQDEEELPDADEDAVGPASETTSSRSPSPDVGGMAFTGASLAAPAGNVVAVFRIMLRAAQTRALAFRMAIQEESRKQKQEASQLEYAKNAPPMCSESEFEKFKESLGASLAVAGEDLSTPSSTAESEKAIIEQSMLMAWWVTSHLSALCTRANSQGTGALEHASALLRGQTTKGATSIKAVGSIFGPPLGVDATTVPSFGVFLKNRQDGGVFGEKNLIHAAERIMFVYLPRFGRLLKAAEMVAQAHETVTGGSLTDPDNALRWAAEWNAAYSRLRPGNTPQTSTTYSVRTAYARALIAQSDGISANVGGMYIATTREVLQADAEERMATALREVYAVPKKVINDPEKLTLREFEAALRALIAEAKTFKGPVSQGWLDGLDKLKEGSEKAFARGKDNTTRRSEAAAAFKRIQELVNAAKRPGGVEADPDKTLRKLMERDRERFWCGLDDTDDVDVDVEPTERYTDAVREYVQALLEAAKQEYETLKMYGYSIEMLEYVRREPDVLLADPAPAAGGALVAAAREKWAATGEYFILQKVDDKGKSDTREGPSHEWKLSLPNGKGRGGMFWKPQTAAYLVERRAKLTKLYDEAQSEGGGKLTRGLRIAKWYAEKAAHLAATRNERKMRVKVERWASSNAPPAGWEGVENKVDTFATTHWNAFMSSLQPNPDDADVKVKMTATNVDAAKALLKGIWNARADASNAVDQKDENALALLYWPKLVPSIPPKWHDAFKPILFKDIDNVAKWLSLPEVMATVRRMWKDEFQSEKTHFYKLQELDLKLDGAIADLREVVDSGVFTAREIQDYSTGKYRRNHRMCPSLECFLYYEKKDPAHTQSINSKDGLLELINAKDAEVVKAVNDKKAPKGSGASGTKARRGGSSITAAGTAAVTGGDADEDNEDDDADDADDAASLKFVEKRRLAIAKAGLKLYAGNPTEALKTPVKADLLESVSAVAAPFYEHELKRLESLKISVKALKQRKEQEQLERARSEQRRKEMIEELAREDGVTSDGSRRHVENFGATRNVLEKEIEAFRNEAVLRRMGREDQVAVDLCIERGWELQEDIEALLSLDEDKLQNDPMALLRTPFSRTQMSLLFCTKDENTQLLMEDPELKRASLSDADQMQMESVADSQSNGAFQMTALPLQRRRLSGARLMSRAPRASMLAAAPPPLWSASRGGRSLLTKATCTQAQAHLQAEQPADVGVGGVLGNVASATMSSSGVKPLSGAKVAVSSLGPLVYNKLIARRLIKNHMRVLAHVHFKTSKARQVEFTRVYAALGDAFTHDEYTGVVTCDEDRLDAIVDGLLPVFKQMTEYYETTLRLRLREAYDALKQLPVLKKGIKSSTASAGAALAEDEDDEDDEDEEAVDKDDVDDDERAQKPPPVGARRGKATGAPGNDEAVMSTQYHKAFTANHYKAVCNRIISENYDAEKATKNVERYKTGLREQWIYRSERVQRAELNANPHQIFGDQPEFLPTLISAPPRMGKTNLTFLQISLWKKMGGVTVMGLGPNKEQPMREMVNKLDLKLGWVRDARKLVAKDFDKFVQGSPETQNWEGGSFNWINMQTTETVDTKKGAKGFAVTRGHMLHTDLYIYSHDVEQDARSTAALLFRLRSYGKVVMHVRDEVQLLCKELDNKGVSGGGQHSRSGKWLAPHATLAWLRPFYSNAFNLNCLVSATIIPSLFETGLWGFMGSHEQMATLQTVERRLQPSDWFKLSELVRRQPWYAYLPKTLKALTPARPFAYIGLEHVVVHNSRYLGVGQQKAMDVSSDLRKRLVQKFALNNFLLAPHTSRGGGTKQSAQRDRWVKELASVDQQIRSQSQEGAYREHDFVAQHFVDWMQTDIVPLKHPRATDSKVYDHEHEYMVPVLVSALNPFVKSKKSSDNSMMGFVFMYAQLAHARAVNVKRDKSMPTSDYDVAFLVYQSVIKDIKTLKSDVLGINSAVLHQPQGGMIKETNKSHAIANDLKSGVKWEEPADSDPIPYVPHDKPEEQKAKTGKLLVLVYSSQAGDNASQTTDGSGVFVVPRLYAVTAFDAEEAANWLARQGILRIAVVGYSMLSAGLTIQCNVHSETADGRKNIPDGAVKTKSANGESLQASLKLSSRKQGSRTTLRFCGSHVALATNESTPMDKQYQTLGRAFFELKNVSPQHPVCSSSNPSERWKINLLGVPGRLESILLYRQIETEFANGSETSATLYELMRQISNDRSYQLWKDDQVSAIVKGQSVTGFFSLDHNDQDAEADAVSLPTVGARKGSMADLFAARNLKALVESSASDDAMLELILFPNGRPKDTEEQDGEEGEARGMEVEQQADSDGLRV